LRPIEVYPFSVHNDFAKGAGRGEAIRQRAGANSFSIRTRFLALFCESEHQDTRDVKPKLASALRATSKNPEKSSLFRLRPFFTVDLLTRVGRILDYQHTEYTIWRKL